MIVEEDGHSSYTSEPFQRPPVTLNINETRMTVPKYPEGMRSSLSSSLASRQRRRKHFPVLFWWVYRNYKFLFLSVLSLLLKKINRKRSKERGVFRTLFLSIFLANQNFNQ